MNILNCLVNKTHCYNFGKFHLILNETPIRHICNFWQNSIIENRDCLLSNWVLLYLGHNKLDLFLFCMQQKGRVNSTICKNKLFFNTQPQYQIPVIQMSFNLLRSYHVTTFLFHSHYELTGIQMADDYLQLQEITIKIPRVENRLIWIFSPRQ